MNKKNAENSAIEKLIMEKSMKIESVISKLLYKTEALSALVVESDGKVKGFEKVAAAIVDDSAILNILIAPSGIVSDVYPVQGNEAVLGFDFFSQSAGNKEAVLARETGELVFGGPFQLIQGGQALVGRLPVYISRKDGRKVFWGLVSVTLKYPEALSGANLDEIERGGLSYILWRVNPDNEKKQVIAGSKKYDHKNNDCIQKQIRILNADWYFCISSGRAWYSYTEIWILSFIGLFISLMTAFIIQNNINLKHAKKQVEQADGAKSAFLSNMNHELRTPVTGIIGFTELMLENKMEPEQIREHLDKIKNSANGLLAIINDILDISEMESGEAKLRKIPFDISETIYLCESICKQEAEEKGLALCVITDITLRQKILGDPERLRRILLNLMTNAVKFTKEGFVTVAISTICESEGMVTLRFEVKDSGIGITKESIEQIQGVFIQADSTLTRKYGGLGVGLAIAKSEIELMGGKLDMESMEGKGSMFHFELVFEMSEERVGLSSTKVKEEDFINRRFQGEVLVCEDDETNQLVIKEQLIKAGLNVTIAPDGKIGVEKALSQMEQSKPFDLIFMDVHMPVMDGLQAAEKLMERGNKTPLIALTANIMADNLENCKRSGMSDCLGKPFMAYELRECLSKYLECSENNHAIDQEAGLQQYEGDKKIYGNIINTFFISNRNTLENLEHTIEKGDIALARRIAHSLRGASGMIGAKRLSDAAFNVEKALTPVGSEFDPNEIKSQLNRLSNEYDAVFRELKYLANIDPNKKNQSIIMDREKLSVLCDRLAPLLKSGNLESRDYLEEIKKEFQPISNNLKHFISQIEQYEFELAYETLKKIRKFMGM